MSRDVYALKLELITKKLNALNNKMHTLSQIY